MTQTFALSRRVELVGEYDLTDQAALASLLGSLAPDGPAVIDLRRVTYFDSTLLSELAKLRIRFKENAITIAGATGNALRVLQIVGFDRLFRIE